jgi:hypothetical protein
MTIVSLEVGSPRPHKELGKQDVKERYSESSVVDIVRERSGWLLVFFGGLMVAAVVVEVFENVLKQHVELSYFVPLVSGPLFSSKCLRRCPHAPHAINLLSFIPHSNLLCFGAAYRTRW